MRRRGSIRVAAALTVSMLALAACGDGGGEVEQETGPVTLHVMNFANYMPDDIIERFKEATGHTIELTLTSSNEDAIAKLDGSPDGTYDIAFVTSPFAEALINAGRFEPLDHAKIPNLSNLYPEASELAFDPGNEYTVPYAWGTTGFCYRTDLVTQTEMDSWNDLLQPSDELAGKITMIDEDRWLLLPALKVLGYSANTTDEAELQEAADLTIQAKQTLLGFDAETFYTKLDSGEAVAVMGWDGWCNYVSDPGVVEWVLPEEGSDLWADVMAIPKGSPHLEAAHQFIDFILQPENGLWVAENILYKVPNAAAMEALDPSFFETYPNMAMTPAELLDQEALRDLGEGQPTFTDAVTQVKAA
jgi:spermidine/putrescine transport system substrate-binding protein